MSDTEITVLPHSHDVGEIRQEASVVQEAAKAYSVEHDGLETGESVLRSIKAFRKGMTERKTEITRPLMDSLASVKDLFRAPEEALVDAEKIIKAKILEYTLAEEVKAVLESEKIASKVEKGLLKAETAVGKLQAIDDKKVKSNLRTVKKLEIVDESLIPREYLDVNRMKVTEALWAGVVVPGARLKDEKIIVTK